MEPDGNSDAESFTWGGETLGHWWVPGGEYDIIEDVVPPRGESTRACRLLGSGSGRLVAILVFPHYISGLLDEYGGLVFHARLESKSGRLLVGPTDKTFSSLEFTVSPEWERFELSFDDLPGWDRRASSIDFLVTEADGPFDLWIDDVSFVCRGECPKFDEP